jgi:hypothetical protein
MSLDRRHTEPTLHKPKASQFIQDSLLNMMPQRSVQIPLPNIANLEDAAHQKAINDNLRGPLQKDFQVLS